MSYLLSKSNKSHLKSNVVKSKKLLHKVPTGEYVGFEMYHLQAGQELKFNTEDTEVCFVLVAGSQYYFNRKSNI